MNNVEDAFIDQMVELMKEENHETQYLDGFGNWVCCLCGLVFPA